MERKKLSLEPGVHYKGTFWLNEYGEIQVKPEQKGTKPMNMKIILENELFSFYESKNLYKVVIKLRKQNLNANSATNRFMFVLTQIYSYIRK